MRREIYLLVEGINDARFVNRIVKPMLKSKFDSVKTYEYQQNPKDDVTKLIKAISSMNNDYVFFADINRKKCVCQKKEEIRGIYGIVDEEKIIIVKKSIESWYYAGLNEEQCKKLEIDVKDQTETIGKKELKRMKPQKFESWLDFLLEIIKRYSIQIAIKKNNSFRYFIEKYALIEEI